MRGEMIDRLDGELRMERIETTRLIGGSLRALQDEARRLGIGTAGPARAGRGLPAGRRPGVRGRAGAGAVTGRQPARSSRGSGVPNGRVEPTRRRADPAIRQPPSPAGTAPHPA